MTRLFISPGPAYPALRHGKVWSPGHRRPACVPAARVYVKCVLPSICILKLANQPVVFQRRTSTQSLSVRWFPGDAPSLAPPPRILILIKATKWQSRESKWMELKKKKKHGKVLEGSWQSGGISFSSAASFLKNKKGKIKKERNKAPLLCKEKAFTLLHIYNLLRK